LARLRARAATMPSAWWRNGRLVCFASRHRSNVSKRREQRMIRQTARRVELFFDNASQRCLAPNFHGPQGPERKPSSVRGACKLDRNNNYIGVRAFIPTGAPIQHDISSGHGSGEGTFYSAVLCPHSVRKSPRHAVSRSDGQQPTRQPGQPFGAPCRRGAGTETPVAAAD
jgi:hypothetical protein